MDGVFSAEALQAHPLAEIFPLMSGAEFAALVADIKAHGLREPIILHDGQILDGRNRYRACNEAAVAPRFVEWDGEGSAEAFVVSKNLHRRHLNESQRGLIAAKLSTLSRGQAGNGRPCGKVGVEISTSTAAQAAELLNVSRDTVVDAKRVLTEGTPDEIIAVERGEAAVSTIADQIRGKRPSQDRAKRRDVPLSKAGKNPERIQRQQMNAEIWGRIRDALTHLSSLPKPQDAADIARKFDKTSLVDARLETATLWLMEFVDAWNSRTQA